MKRCISLIFTCFVLILVMVACKPRQESIVHINMDYPAYSTLDEAVGAANLIVEGKSLGKEYKMLDIGSGESSSMPYTVYDIEVVKVYKGDIKEGDVIEVKILGGKFKDVEYVLASPSPILNDDGEYVLFLSTYEDSPASLINPIDSVFELKDGNLQALNSKSFIKPFRLDELANKSNQ